MKNKNLALNKTLALPMQKNSHSIAKVKPKIRVVHLQTPEVIEIEPADFQKFAQSLTGNSTETISKHNKPKSSSKDEPIILCDESSNTEVEACPKENFSPSHTKGFATCRKKGNLSQKTNLSLPKHKGLHSTGNMKQQVRITHTPEVKEIEPADFQKVVQSLTGKSSAVETELKKPKHSSKKVPIILCDEVSSREEMDILHEFRSCLEHRDEKTTDEEEMTSLENLSDERTSSTEMDIFNEFQSCFEYRDEKTIDEDEMTSWENLAEESTIGFEDLDKFINELVDFNCFL